MYLRVQFCLQSFCVKRVPSDDRNRETRVSHQVSEKRRQPLTLPFQTVLGLFKDTTLLLSMPMGELTSQTPIASEYRSTFFHFHLKDIRKGSGDGGLSVPEEHRKMTCSRGIRDRTKSPF